MIQKILLFATVICLCSSYASGFYSDGLDVRDRKYFVRNTTYQRCIAGSRERMANAIYSYSFADQTGAKIYELNKSIEFIKYVKGSGQISFVSGKDFYLINKEGVKVDGFSDPEYQIMEYVWHPDGKKVVYISGSDEYNEEGPPYYTSKGVWQYDFETKQRTLLIPSGYDLVKDMPEQYLYYWNGSLSSSQIYRYSFATGRSTLFDTQVEHFYGPLFNNGLSPDNRYMVYHLHPELEGPPYWGTVRIYDFKEQRVLSPEEIGDISGKYGSQVIWSQSGTYIAFMGQKERDVYEEYVYIYNFKKKEYVERVKGRLVGYDPDHTAIVVCADGEFVIKEFPNE